MMNKPVQIKLPGKTKELSLNGSCQYHLEGDWIKLSADEIANNRIENTLSGEISVELWALPAPYQGGQFQGQVMAGCQIGTLSGQYGLQKWEATQPLQMPSEGEWYLTLMLREWDNGSYVTRDFLNFPDAVRVGHRKTLSFV